MNKLLALGILTPLLILVAPHVNAESDAKRASDGFNDGSNQARSDTSFNPACDPLGVHSSDGQHTTIYCNAWTQGYVSTWNQLYPPQQPTQSVGPGANGQQVNPNIILECKNVVNCNPDTAQRTDTNGQVTTK